MSKPLGGVMKPQISPRHFSTVESERVSTSHYSGM